ncbi:transcriptional repressor LexA [Patescibacteria group bacterium]
MDRLTKKQRQVLDYVQEFTADKGYAPSYREIADNFKLSSVATVHEHIRNLEKKGFVSCENNEARSLQVVEPALVDFDSDGSEVQLAGIITAGQPIEAIEEKETVVVPPIFIKNTKKYYALRVKGESMIEDGIFDGDIVVLEQIDQANNGDIVVALIDNEYATLKRWYKEKDHIRLQPANSTMEPLKVNNAVVQGRVVGMIRNYA